VSFETEINKKESKRETLARFKPQRSLTEGLVSLGGGVYSISFSFKLEGIKRNGAALTSVFLDPPTTNDTYFYNESTGTIKIKLASAPNISTNVIIASYYIFFSSGDTVYNLDPEDTGTELVLWKPCIQDDPDLSQAIENLESGILTVSSTNISLVNDQFEIYLTDQDSFYNTEAIIWISVNGEFAKFYVGKTTAISINRDTVEFSIADSFASLSDPCYMGDTASQAYNTNATSTGGDFFAPVPFVFGSSRRSFVTNAIATVREDVSAPGPGIAVAGGGWHLDPLNCPKGSYNGSKSYETSGTVNRGPWLIARTTGDFKTLDFGTISSIRLETTPTAGTDDEYFVYRGTNYGWIFFSSIGHNLEIGDSFSFTHTSINGGATQHAIVVNERKTAIAFGPPRGFSCILKSRSNITSSATLTTTGLTMNANQAPAIVLKQKDSPNYDGLYVLSYPKDFSYSISTLASGNKLMTVTLDNDFETDTNIDGTVYHPSMNTVTPDNTEMFFRVVQNDADNTHGKAITAILNSLDIDVDSASVTSADAALVTGISMTIPSHNQQEYDSYFSYIRQILKSSFAYLKFDQTTTEAKYNLIGALSASDEINENIYAERSLSVEVDYNDIVTDIYFVNTSLPLTIAETGSNTRSFNLSSNYAKYLYGKQKKVTYEHVLNTMTARSDVILGVLSKRIATYSFKVSSKLLDSLLGDDIIMVSGQVLSDDGSKDLKIISIKKSANEVSVSARDLLGI
jgi:hypothetical protein